MTKAPSRLPPPFPPGGPPPGFTPPPGGGLLRNSLFLALSRGLQILTGFFMVIALVRYMSVDAYGEFAYLTALAQAVMTFSYFGIQDVVVREIARDKSRAPGHLGAGYVLRLILSLAAGLIIAAVALFSDLTPMARFCLLLAFCAELFRSLSMLAYASFQAFERMGFEPLLSGLQALLTLVFLGGAIVLNLGMAGVFAAIALALGLHFAATLLIASRRFVRPSFAFSRAELWELFLAAAVIGVGIILQMNLMRAGALMLKWLGNVDEVAYFQAAHELVVKIQVFPQALMLAVFPVLARLLASREGREEAERLYRLLFRYILLLGLPVSLLFGVFPRESAVLLFGEKYLPAAGVLRIVGLAVVPLALDMLLNRTLIAMNRQRYAAGYAAAALLLAVGLNAVLIPAYGPEGAAGAALAAYLVLLCSSAWFAAKNGVRPAAWADLARAFLASGAAIETAFALSSLGGLSGLSSLVRAAAMLIVYFGVLAALRAFPRRDIQGLKDALRRKPPKGKEFAA